jgi:hypothetical protein
MLGAARGFNWVIRSLVRSGVERLARDLPFQQRHNWKISVTVTFLQIRHTYRHLSLAKGGQSKEAMLRIAQDYEHLAERAKLRAKRPPHSN